MIDVVVKISWSYEIFSALFENKDPNCESLEIKARKAHPEFFLAMNDSLLCGLCNGVALLFKRKEKETSIYSLIKRVEESKPDLAKKLREQIQLHHNLVEKIRGIRNEFCAHRNKFKTPPQVFSEVQLHLNELKTVVKLARHVVCILAEQSGKCKRELLETQQLSKETLQCVANDAHLVMKAFVKPC